MNEPRNDLVIGVFEQEAQAEQAVSALWRAGFAPDRIDMANRRMGVVAGTPRMQFQKEAADGATTGAVAGAVLGPWPGRWPVRCCPALAPSWAESAGPLWGPPAVLSSDPSSPWKYRRKKPIIIPMRSSRAHPRDRAPDRTLGRGARDSPQPRRTRTSRLSGPVNVALRHSQPPANRRRQLPGEASPGS